MKVLYVQPNGIGNIILSTPAMRAIRSVFPRAHYDLLINPSGVPALEGWTLFDNILTDATLLDATLYDAVVLAEPRIDAFCPSLVKRARKLVVHPTSGYRTHVLRPA